MLNWIYFLISLTLGLGAGIYSAQYGVRQGATTPAVVIGPWQSITEIDDNELNPYALAHMSNYGNLKLGNFEALYFTAKDDDEKKSLSGNCEYTVTGKVPEAKWWSITIYDQDGMLIENQAERYSFNATNMRIKNNAAFNISLAANARPDNWIPIKPDQPFVIVLRLYSPDINSIRDANEISFPRIERLNCS